MAEKGFEIKEKAIILMENMKQQTNKKEKLGEKFRIKFVVVTIFALPCFCD